MMLVGNDMVWVDSVLRWFSLASFGSSIISDSRGFTTFVRDDCLTKCHCPLSYNSPSLHWQSRKLFSKKIAHKLYPTLQSNQNEARLGKGTKVQIEIKDRGIFFHARFSKTIHPSELTTIYWFPCEHATTIFHWKKSLIFCQEISKLKCSPKSNSLAVYF